jgi:sulfate adenylyltransferase (ADP) / ATP adenylyltransferase
MAVHLAFCEIPIGERRGVGTGWTRESESTKLSVMREDGALCARIDEVAARARRTGALVPIGSSIERIRDGNIEFVVRLASPHLAQKDALEAARGRDHDPFLPYDPELFVAAVPPRHVALLNKFYVLERHLLIVTREFEEQEAPLTRADFEAWWWGLSRLDALGFYNGGKVAGASQRHKHLQLVPLELAPGAGVPVEAALGEPATDGWRPVPGLTFDHVAIGLDEKMAERPSEAAAYGLERYGEALARFSLGKVGDARVSPYDLLVTRRWMLLVPRRRERFEGVEVNALGYAGALLARGPEQLERLREVGPMRVLGALASETPR